MGIQVVVVVVERRASSEGSGAQVVAEGFGGRKREGISSNRPLNLEIAGVAGVEYRERSEKTITIPPLAFIFPRS